MSSAPTRFGAANHRLQWACGPGASPARQGVGERRPRSGRRVPRPLPRRPLWNAPTRLRYLFRDSAPDTNQVVSRRPPATPPPTPLELPQLLLGLLATRPDSDTFPQPDPSSTPSPTLRHASTSHLPAPNRPAANEAADLAPRPRAGVDVPRHPAPSHPVGHGVGGSPPPHVQQG